MSSQRILLGSTTSLLTYPLAAPGGSLVRARPSSATVRVGTPAVSIPTTGDNATVDSLDAGTVSVAAAEGDTQLTLSTGTTITKDRLYLIDLDGSAGTNETRIIVRNVGSNGSTMFLASPLPCAVPANAKVYGYSITHALTTAETATAGPGIAIWTATVDGVVMSWSQQFRIVRRIPIVPLTVTDLISVYPQILRLQSVTDTTLDNLIAAAWEYRILHRLAAKGVREEDIVDSEVLRPWLALACLVHAVCRDESASEQWRESLEADCERAVEVTFGRVDWYEADQEDDPVPTLDAPAPRRLGITVHR